MENQRVTLENLGKGAAMERFQDELTRVLENIMDPNTPATTVRSVTLTVKIKPDKERSTANVTYQATAKLAQVQPDETTFFLGQSATGEVAAVEHNPKQLQLFQEPDVSGKVVPIASKTAELAGKE